MTHHIKLCNFYSYLTHSEAGIGLNAVSFIRNKDTETLASCLSQETERKGGERRRLWGGCIALSVSTAVWETMKGKKCKILARKECIFYERDTHLFPFFTDQTHTCAHHLPQYLKQIWRILHELRWEQGILWVFVSEFMYEALGVFLGFVILSLSLYYVNIIISLCL